MLFCVRRVWARLSLLSGPESLSEQPSKPHSTTGPDTFRLLSGVGEGESRARPSDNQVQNVLRIEPPNERDGANERAQLLCNVVASTTMLIRALLLTLSTKSTSPRFRLLSHVRM